jgi:hypothetical protein
MKPLQGGIEIHQEEFLAEWSRAIKDEQVFIPEDEHIRMNETGRLLWNH